MEKNLTMHCYISGKVQGVWFRANTKEQADSLGLTGWVKNLADGRVEVLASGKGSQLDKLHEWLKKGPALAEVFECIRENSEAELHRGFRIL